jgi:guanylate kinase
MEFSKEPGMYDHIILNDQLEAAYQNLREILRQVKENLFRNFITNFLIGFFFFF